VHALPIDYPQLVTALADCLGKARAGLLTLDEGDDPDVTLAALDEASTRLGVPVLRSWVGHGFDTLAWVYRDDPRLAARPESVIVGVRAAG
jgi:hypothetical protein